MVKAAQLESEQRTHATAISRYLKKLYFGDTDPTKRGAISRGQSKAQGKDIKVFLLRGPMKLIW
jgi:hypothetical protein